MRRRALLASLAAVAGCTAAPRANSPTPEAGTPPSNDGSPGCPPAPTSETEVRCSHADAESSVRMTAASSTLSLPRDSNRFTLRNESDTRLNSTAGAYQLFVHTGDGWEFVAPKVSTGAVQPIELGPGDTRDWTLSANTENLGSLAPPESGTDSRSLAFRLLPGTHAFGFRATPEGSETPRLYATTFTVSGDAPPLVPSDSVDSHSRDGDTLTVTTQTTMEYDHSRRVSLLLRRRPDARNAASLGLFELYNPLYEQVPSYDSPFVPPLVAELLRDAFAFAESSDGRVRVRTVDTTRPPLGLGGGESLSVRYGGATWEVTSRNGWE